MDIHTLTEFADISRNVASYDWVVQKQSSNGVFEYVQFSNGTFIAVSRTFYKNIYIQVSGSEWNRLENDYEYKIKFRSCACTYFR